MTATPLARSPLTVLPLAFLFIIGRPDSAPPRLPPLPPLPPRSEAHGRAADPINLVLLGGAADVEQAFRTVGWTRAAHKSVGSLIKEGFAVLARRPDAHAPVATQHVAGRVQDAAYELAGATARVRDHVRLWRVGAGDGTWAGAATQDVGMLLNPLKRRFTHRIAPAVDDERDRIVASLRLAGCADLLGYVRLTGAVERGRNAANQPFFTDGRAAVMRVHACPQPRR